MRTHTLQDATGVFNRVAPLGAAYVVKNTTPTNGQPGFMTGCFWVNTAGTAGTIFYVNTGTSTSSTWTSVA